MNSMAQRVHSAPIGGEHLFVPALANQRPKATRGHRVAVRLYSVLSRWSTKLKEDAESENFSSKHMENRERFVCVQAWI